ncbi:Werner Syndrome-like exonuclease [Triticum urartu]|uniref:Werner Syndrome-like exonuclease n=1 Tax=Triticum urartu TaxID=4572 RepID=UPI0020448A50|nr:Werner Syndrome-like exonuclease [Triticum urartu]
MATTRHTVPFGSARINTTVTSDTDAADEWVRRVRAANDPADRGLIVGLDCEWKPNYSSWTTSKVAILQLCVGTSCLVLQMFYANRVPAAIRGLLGDPTVRCVGIGVGEDAAKLADDYGLVCAAPVDLEARCNEYLGIGGGLGRTRLGLKGYAREVLGLTMEKPRHVTMSNWERRQLDVAQVQYACIDAYVSYKLGERLLDN